MQESVEDFKKITPSSLWPIVEKLQIFFETICRADTLAMISAVEDLNQVIQAAQRDGNLRLIGELKVLTGDFQDGKDILNDFVFGEKQSTSGFLYLWLLYLVGVANEGLGNIDEAVSNYEEVLKYWKNPDIEISEIKDLKIRLAKLTS